MFRNLFFVLSIVLRLGLMASCGSNNPSATEETPTTDIQDATLVEEEVSPIIFQAEDTLCYHGYVFIPEKVRARMQGKSMKGQTDIGYDDLRYLTLYHYDFDNHIQQGEMVCNKATDYVDRSKQFPHKIDDNDLCKKTFESHGFRWGGHWRSVKDYQHFEKKVK